MTGLVEFPAARIRREKKFLRWHLPLTTHEEFQRRRHIHSLATGHHYPSGACGTAVIHVRLRARDHQISPWEDIGGIFDRFFDAVSGIAGGTRDMLNKFSSGGIYDPDFGKGQPTVCFDPGEHIMPREKPVYTQGDQLEHATYGWPCVVVGYGWPAPGEYLVEATMPDGRVFTLPVRPGLLRRARRRDTDPPPAA